MVDAGRVKSTQCCAWLSDLLQPNEAVTPKRVQCSVTFAQLDVFPTRVTYVARVSHPILETVIVMFHVGKPTRMACVDGGKMLLNDAFRCFTEAH